MLEMLEQNATFLDTLADTLEAYACANMERGAGLAVEAALCRKRATEIRTFLKHYEN
jgi:hypothetical protein